MKSYSTIKIHLQDESKTVCTQISFNESEISHLNNLPHRSNKGIIYHVLNFFIFGCKRDVGYHLKESFSVEDLLAGNVCGNSENLKIKLKIRKSTDQNSGAMINSPINENLELTEAELRLWFNIAIVAISICSSLIIGNLIYCFKRYFEIGILITEFF